MSMFERIRSGELSKEAFKKQLAGYEADKIVLQRNVNMFGPELFQSKLKDIEMSINMTKLFIDKFDDITQGPDKKTDKKKWPQTNY